LCAWIVRREVTLFAWLRPITVLHSVQMRRYEPVQGLRSEMIRLLWTRDVAATGDLSDKLMECAREKQLDEAMQVMKSLSREERMAISGRPDKDGRTALITAMIGFGNVVAFVTFLLDECGADVDQCGFVELHDSDDNDCHIPKCQVV